MTCNIMTIKRKQIKNSIQPFNHCMIIAIVKFIFVMSLFFTLFLFSGQSENANNPG